MRSETELRGGRLALRAAYSSLTISIEIPKMIG